MQRNLVILFLFFILASETGFGQFYIKQTGDSTYYESLPDPEDPVQVYIELSAGTKYVRYIDPDQGLVFGIPDSTRPIRTGSRMYALLGLPEIRGIKDYISITTIFKPDYKTLEEVMQDRLLHNRSGEYFNGHGPTVFYSATALTSTNPAWKTYKVELNCNGESECTHSWVFAEGKKAWVIFILAAKKATWEERQPVFSSFIKNVKLN